MPQGAATTPPTGADSLRVPAQPAAPLAAPPGCGGSRGSIGGPGRQQGKGQSCPRTGTRVAGKRPLTHPPNSRQTAPECAAAPASPERAACPGRVPAGLGGAAYPQHRVGPGQPGAGRGARDSWCGVRLPLAAGRDVPPRSRPYNRAILPRRARGRCGEQRCPPGHGPGVLSPRLPVGAVPRGPAAPLPSAGGQLLPGAGHSGQRCAPCTSCLRGGGGVLYRPARGVGPRLPAVPSSRAAGLRHVHLPRGRLPAATVGARPPLSRPGRRGAAAPLVLPRGHPRTQLPDPRGAPHLRVDASEAEPAREK